MRVYNLGVPTLERVFVKRTGAGSGTTGLLKLLGDHASASLSTGLGSTSRAANPDGTALPDG